MTNSRPAHLSTDEAKRIAGRLFNEALNAAGYPSEIEHNRRIAEAIGYAPSGERHVREFREGLSFITLSKILQLCAHRPDAGRAVVARVVAWMLPEREQRPAIVAVRELLCETLDLARLLADVSADGEVDPEEQARVEPQLARVRRAMDRVVSTFARQGERGAS